MAEISTPVRTTYDQGVRLHADPGVWVFDGFVTPAERAHLMELARPRLVPARVSDDRAGVVSAGRTNRVHWIRHDVTPRVRGIVDRVADLVGLPSDHAESVQVIHYRTGEEYRAHRDAYDRATERGRRCTERGGQRLVTVLGYLNEVAGGGATEFGELDLTVEPRPGRLLVFHNCRPGTDEPHPDSLHQASRVTAGEKWAFNLWFRERPQRRAASWPSESIGSPSP